MNRPYRQITLEREGDVVFARLRASRLEENDIHLLGNELLDLIEQDGCRKLVLSLEGHNLHCLYSVFLAKLVMVLRRLQEHRGALILSEVSPEVKGVFDACKLGDLFEFAPNREAAREALARKKLA